MNMIDSDDMMKRNVLRKVEDGRRGEKRGKDKVRRKIGGKTFHSLGVSVSRYEYLGVGGLMMG